LILGEDINVKIKKDQTAIIKVNLKNNAICDLGWSTPSSGTIEKISIDKLKYVPAQGSTGNIEFNIFCNVIG
jgi:hypothetical protein